MTLSANSNSAPFAHKRYLHRSGDMLTAPEIMDRIRMGQSAEPPITLLVIPAPKRRSR